MAYTWKDVGPAVGGKVITQADRQKIADEWNAYELEKPLIDWKRKMAKSDAILRGRVVEEGGLPVRGAALKIDDDIVFTDSQGSFLLRRRWWWQLSLLKSVQSPVYLLQKEDIQNSPKGRSRL